MLEGHFVYKYEMWWVRISKEICDIVRATDQASPLVAPPNMASVRHGKLSSMIS